MKKFLCLLLAMMTLASAALAVELEYTLPEKFSQQVKFGSGVKGTATISVSGGAEWLNLLLPFTGSELQIRAIQTKEGDNLSASQRAAGFGFQYQVYVLDEEGRQRATTKLYGDKENAYLSSELLPDTILSFPQGGRLLETLLNSEGENPTIYSLVQKISDVSDDMWKSAWLPALSRYESALELWLDQYADEPAMQSRGEGNSVMLLRYVIPASAVKAQIEALMSELLQDQVMLSLLRPLMSVEQQAVYLNPALMYYYEAVVDALPLQGEIMLNREMSMMGEVLSTSVILPLPGNDGGWEELQYDLTGSDSAFSLSGDKTTVTLLMNQSASNAESNMWTGIVRVLREEGEQLSASFELKKAFTTSKDDEGYGHEHTRWALKASPDLSHLEEGDEARDEYLMFEPISLELDLHYFSKSSNNNPTTLEFALNAQVPTFALELTGSIKTSNAWALETLSVEPAESFLDLSDERRAELTEKFIQNATATMTSLYATPEPTPTLTPEPTPEPTATPTAEPTATPTAEPTATPTAEPTATPTAEPTATPTAEPTATPTAEPTATPTAEPTVTPTEEPAASPEPTAVITPPAQVDLSSETSDSESSGQ